MRERPFVDTNFLGKIRITPACAGKTLPFYIVWYFNKDHPRVCGKDFSSKYALSGIAGSPPRVRERHLIDPLFFNVSDLADLQIHSLLLTEHALIEHLPRPDVKLIRLSRRLVTHPPVYRISETFSLSLQGS